MGFLDFIFDFRRKKLKHYLDRGAMVLDVRTQDELGSGTIPNALHIPLDDLQNHVEELKELGKPLIVCSVSNVRSMKAVKFLNLNNIDAINAGNWKLLKSAIEA